MGRVELIQEVRAGRDDAVRVEEWVRPVVVRPDVRHVDAEAGAGELVQVAGEVEEVGVVSEDAAAIAAEERLCGVRACACVMMR